MLNRNSSWERSFGFITCQNRPVYGGRAGIPHIESSYVDCPIVVCTEAVSAGKTLKEACMPFCFQTPASATGLAGVSGFRIGYFDALSNGFVFNKALELLESPLMHPFIVSSGSTDMLEVFHYNRIAYFEPADDFLRDVVVLPSLELSPAAAQFLEFSFGSFRAFGLEACHNSLMPYPQMLDAFVETPVACNGKVVYAEVDSENESVVTLPESDFFGEPETEEQLPFLIDKVAFLDTPIKILPVAFWNCDGEFYTTLYSGQGERFPILDRSTSWEIVADCHIPFDNGLGVGLFDNFHCLFYGIDGKLGLKPEDVSDFPITNFMQVIPISYSHFPSKINTELDCLGVNLHSADNSPIERDSDLGCDNRLHSGYLDSVFKNLTEAAFLPPLKGVGFQPIF